MELIWQAVLDMVEIDSRGGIMIELILRSGLGNQMFQYAYARKMQAIFKEPIVVNTSYMDKKIFLKSF